MTRTDPATVPAPEQLVRSPELGALATLAFQLATTRAQLAAIHEGGGAPERADQGRALVRTAALLQLQVDAYCRLVVDPRPAISVQIGAGHRR